MRLSEVRGDNENMRMENATLECRDGKRDKNWSGSLSVIFVKFVLLAVWSAISIIIVRLSVCLTVYLWHYALWLSIYPTAKVSEQVNRKCPHRNRTIQLSTFYTNIKPSNSPPQKFLMQYDRLSQQQLGFLFLFMHADWLTLMSLWITPNLTRRAGGVMTYRLWEWDHAK